MTSDDNQIRPQHTTQTHNKHHHHGGGAANPSSGIDLMNPHHTRGGQPFTCVFSEADAEGFCLLYLLNVEILKLQKLIYAYQKPLCFIEIGLVH